MKIALSFGKYIFFYLDNKKNRIFLSMIDKKIADNIKKLEGIKIIQSKINGNVKLENHVSITNAVISSNISKIHIKSFVSIAPYVSIIGHLHNYKRITSYYIFQNLIEDKEMNNDIITKGDLIIEEDVWIGAGAVILSGVTVGRGSIIGANSVCNKNIERYSIVAGVPAKFLKKRFIEKTINEIEDSKWWSWDIKKIKKNKIFFAENMERKN